MWIGTFIFFITSYLHISFNEYLHCNSWDLLIIDVRGWVTEYYLIKFDINLNFSVNLGNFQLGATKQHVYLSFLYTFHAYSSHIYQYTTKIEPILLFSINFIHKYMDKHMFLGQVIFFKTICY